MQRLILALSVLAMIMAAFPGVARSTAEGSILPASDIAPSLTVGPPSIEISVGATVARRALLDEAVAMFETNGLELPALDVQFFDDPTGCQGHPGLFFDENSPRTVLICSELPFVLPHELAHAWASLNLDDDERASYTQARGLETWDDHNAEWSDRGTEDAAFIIQQNLKHATVPPTSRTWQERMAAYELLTGMTSPLAAEVPKVG